MGTAVIRAAIIDVSDGDLDTGLRFWPQTLRLQPHHGDGAAYHRSPQRATSVSFALQRIGERPARVHVDFSTEDVEAEVGREGDSP